MNATHACNTCTRAAIGASSSSSAVERPFVWQKIEEMRYLESGYVYAVTVHRLQPLELSQCRVSKFEALEDENKEEGDKGNGGVGVRGDGRKEDEGDGVARGDVRYSNPCWKLGRNKISPPFPQDAILKGRKRGRNKMS